VLSANCVPNLVLYALTIKDRGLVIDSKLHFHYHFGHVFFLGKWVIRFNWVCEVFSFFSGHAADAGVGRHQSASTPATLDAENENYVLHFVFRVWAIDTATAKSSPK
jgi:hypothetical protein